jgi:hypothetical protein
MTDKKMKSKEVAKLKHFEPKKKDHAEFHALHYIKDIMSDKFMPVVLNDKLIAGAGNIDLDKEYMLVQDVSDLNQDKLREYLRNTITLAIRLSVGGGTKEHIAKSKELWKRAIDYGNKQTNGKKWKYKP